MLLIPSFCDCQESICLLYSIWLLFASKANLYYSREEVLETFAHTAELICRVQNHLYHFLKELIGSVPIGEGPEDVAQWRG